MKVIKQEDLLNKIVLYEAFNGKCGYCQWVECCYGILCSDCPADYDDREKHTYKQALKWWAKAKLKETT